MNGALQIPVLQLVAAYLFVLLLLAAVRLRGISREREILLAAVRMTLQLVAAGYVLLWLFDQASPAVTLAAILLMEAFAISTIVRRIRPRPGPALRRVIAGSMLLGTLGGIAFFLAVVLPAHPWFDPRYVIPLAGMLIGNSMTGISLGVTRLVHDIHQQRETVEAALMLGAPPRQACRHIVNDSFDAAILPTINSMIGIGIVFLPGMMTGQILSGSSPLVAIRYQIAVMLGILGCVTLCLILFTRYAYRTFFNDQQQLLATGPPENS